MRRLILICLMILPAGMCRPRVEYRTLETAIPESLIAEVPRPDRPLVTYKDAVLRDAERGAVIDRMNDDRAAVRSILEKE